MASISSLGIGSGLDIGGLVSSLISAEGAAKSARLDRREIDYQAKLSIIGSVKSALKDFQSSYSSLKLSSTFKSFTASSSDTSAFTATVKNGATAASYSLTVDQVAKAHKFKSLEYADKTASIATGTLTFTKGDTTSVDVVIEDGSLEGIRDAINDADFGVEASIIYNGTGYVLSMATETGDDNRIASIAASVTTTGSFADFIDADLSAPSGSLTNIQVAQHAIFTVNGVGITSQTNTITNIIDNVTIELKQGDGAIATETLTIGRDTSGVKEAVQSFVDGYNDLIRGLNSATYYDADSEESGILIGDPTVRGIVSQLRGMLNVTTGDALTEFNSFASIGILTARDGTLEFDSSKLDSALSSKPDEVQHLLAGGGASVSGINTDIIGVTDNIGAGRYTVDITSLPLATHEGAAFVPAGNSFKVGTPLLPGENLDFTVKLDGFTSAVLSLPASNYGDGDSVALAIQNLINADATLSAAGRSAGVTYQESDTVPGEFYYKFTSTTLGESSSLEIDFDAASILDDFIDTAGGTQGTAKTGESSGAGTIGGIAATFDGNRMTGTGLYSGFVLDITGGTTGTRTITVAGGNIGKLDSLINSLLDADGSLTAKTTGLSASIESINEQRAALALRLESLETRLIKQFSAMDSLVAQMNSTSSFLTSQLEQVSNIGKK